MVKRDPDQIYKEPTVKKIWPYFKLPVLAGLAGLAIKKKDFLGAYTNIKDLTEEIVRLRELKDENHGQYFKQFGMSYYQISSSVLNQLIKSLDIKPSWSRQSSYNSTDHWVIEKYAFQGVCLFKSYHNSDKDTISFFREETVNPATIEDCLHKHIIEIFSPHIEIKIDRNNRWSESNFVLDNYNVNEDLFIPDQEAIKTMEQEIVQSDKLRLGGRSFLLIGEAGCGKTTVAHYLVNRIGGISLSVPLDELIENTNTIVGTIKIIRPRVIVLDDLDHGEIDIRRALSIIQELNTKNLTVIGTCNDLSQLEGPLIRPGRFDRIIKIGPPSPEVRKFIMSKYLESYGTRLCNEYLEKLVTETEGFPGAHLKELIFLVSMKDFHEVVTKEIPILRNRIFGKKESDSEESDP
jgi:hypothetical protein